MGKIYVVHFADGTYRSLASFSMNRAQLFYELTQLIEKYVGHESGLSADRGFDEFEVDSKKFVNFFERFWQIGWLSDNNNSFAISWASWAAGIIENITLNPVLWIDTQGNTLQIHRYQLDDKELEQELEQKKRVGKLEIIRCKTNKTDITI